MPPAGNAYTGPPRRMRHRGSAEGPAAVAEKRSRAVTAA